MSRVQEPPVGQLITPKHATHTHTHTHTHTGVLEEAKFFGISKAIEPLETIVQNEELSISGHFSRKEFLRMLSITSSSAILRCQVGEPLNFYLSLSLIYLLMLSTYHLIALYI